jgi:hypothetical protein
VNTFSTGLAFRVPKHYHLEITEHPKLYAAGYHMVGSPLIVNYVQDQDDPEEVIVPLMKFKEAEDIELPFRACIAIMRQTEHAVFTEVVANSVPSRGSTRNTTSRSRRYDDEDDEEVAPRPRAPKARAAPKHQGKAVSSKSHMF